MQGEVGAIDRPGLADRVEELAGQAFEVGLGDGAARGDAARSEASDDFETRLGLEHLQRPADLAAEMPVIVEESLAALDRKIVVRVGTGLNEQISWMHSAIKMLAIGDSA